MEAATTGKNRLHIGRFRSEYLVPAAHPDPHRLQRRLDAMFETRLPEVLQASLSSWFSGSDESVWLIRRLEVPVIVNTGWSPDQSAHRFAREVASVLAQAVSGGGEDVLRFPNQAAYLTQFLADLAAGHAQSAWYYEAFRGLSALPLSSALRTAICEEPHTGLAALISLPARAEAQVLAALTSQDAGRIFDHLPGASSTEQPTAEFDRLWTAWLDLGVDISSTDRVPSETLRLYLQVCRVQPDSGSASLKAMARALLRMAHRLGAAPEDERLFTALAAKDTAALVAMAGGSKVLLPLLRVAPGRVQAAGRALQTRRSRADISDVHRSTAFGGLFLLLPMLDALPIDEATRDWPDLRGSRAADVVRFLILIKCFGRRRASRMFFDSLVRDLMQVAPAIAWEDVRGWLWRRSPSELNAFLASAAVWQRERDAVGGEDLALVRVPLPGAAAGIFLDRRRGVWLFAASHAPHRPRNLIERVRSWVASAGFTPKHLVVDCAFGEGARAAFHGITVEMAEHPLDRVLADDLRELVQPSALRTVRPADLALSVAAQQVLRTFAWRLPGFAASSQPYLLANLLDIPGVLDDEAERRVVRLGQPPLQYVLGLTGMASGSYRLSWLDPRPFVLFQESH